MVQCGKVLNYRKKKKKQQQQKGEANGNAINLRACLFVCLFVGWVYDKIKASVGGRRGKKIGGRYSLDSLSLSL